MLRTVANRSQREKDIREYKDQRNLVVKLNVMSIQAKTIDNEKHFEKLLIACSQIETQCVKR